jgi:hypothetical protein
MTDPAEAPHPNTEFIRQAVEWLHANATMDQALDFYEDMAKDPNCDEWTIAELGKRDRFYLLTHLCGRIDAIHPWQYARAREVEAEPDECIDLWARDHYKSTWITFAGSIQEILNNPEITIGIFSHTRPIAKGFSSQIQKELETNQNLIKLYPNILYTNPRRESPRWSADAFTVKRKSNPKEATVEAWGMVDGQPTSTHFALLIFDDVVTLENVNTPDQIIKTTNAWEVAQNLGRSQNPRRWHIGTRYNFADTWGVLLGRKFLKPRIYPATDDGSIDGNPVFLSQEVWDKKKRESSVYTIACQQLLNPVAGSEQTFKPQWIRYWEIRPKTLNVYIMVDYAGSRPTTGSSNTGMTVVGIDNAYNKYLVDGLCHKMTLSERWSNLKALRKYWINQPGVQTVQVGYERYGAQSDIEHFEEMMKIEGDAFPIEELNWPRDGMHAKDERIKRLQPDHQNWRFFYPLPPTGPYFDADGQRQQVTTQQGLTKLQSRTKEGGNEYLIARAIKAKNEEGRLYDVVQKFIDNEYLFFPNTVYKDFFDAMSRIYDMDPQPPTIYQEADLMPDYVED